MENESFKIFGQAIELSENKTFIEMTNRLCYYGEPNLNGVVLPVESASLLAQTLIEQPVVAKYKKIKGKPDLGGHEMVITKNDVEFNTETIGVHTAVEIKDDIVEVNGVTKTLPCLFAKCKIWTRHKNMISAIKRLFSEGKLFSSWEIKTSSYKVKDGIKYLEDYVFEANCLLGSGKRPAYGNCATALTLAENDEKAELLIAEALTIDMNNSVIREDKNMNVDKNDVSLNEGTENIELDVSKTIVSDLTDRDLRNKIGKLCSQKIGYCWVSFIFPNEKYALIESENRESELEYLKFSYEVNNDNVTIGEPEKIKLTVSVANINNTIAEKNNEILRANEEIKELKEQVITLSSYKETVEKIEKEKADRELSENQENLKNYAIKSGYITKEEIETSETIKNLITNVDENAIKAIIVDRLMAQKTDKIDSKFESIVSENNETVNLVSNDNEVIDYKSVMKKFLNK